VLAAYRSHRHPSFLLAQNADDLLFREPASLHPSASLSGSRTLPQAGGVFRAQVKVRVRPLRPPDCGGGQRGTQHGAAVPGPVRRSRAELATASGVDRARTGGVIAAQTLVPAARDRGGP
jgi:hypothetical protein